MDRNIEIGDWARLDGYIGQVLYIREFYVEPFVELSSYEVPDERGVYKTLYGIKKFCDYDFNICKKHSVEFSPHAHKLEESDLIKIQDLKIRHKDLYYNYLVYAEKEFSEYALQLRYLVPIESTIDYVDLLAELFDILFPCFTFKEFQREFKKRNKEINLKKFIRKGEYLDYTGKKSVKFVFYSRNEGTDKNQRVFTGVRAFVG